MFKKGVLIPIYKGLYSTVPIEQLDPLELGKQLFTITYLTTETVLAKDGIITQTTYAYTFVSSQSKKVNVGNWNLSIRRLKDEYLYNTIGIVNKNGNFVATTERLLPICFISTQNTISTLQKASTLKRWRLYKKTIGYK
jgi:hypothetical protein